MAEPTRPASAAQLRPLARPGEAASELQPLAPTHEAVADGRAGVRPAPRPEGLGPTTSAEVASNATVAGALEMRQTSLIGLFSGPGGRTALLRLGTGVVVRAAQGDVIGGAVVTAIAEDALRLWQDGQERVLTMPA